MHQAVSCTGVRRRAGTKISSQNQAGVSTGACVIGERFNRPKEEKRQRRMLRWQCRELGAVVYNKRETRERTLPACGC